MAIPYKARDWYTYTSDDGNSYSVKIDAAVGQDSNFGFTVYSAANPIAPAGLRMRYGYYQHATDGRVRKIPMGAITAHHWDGTHTQVRLYDEKDETGALWTLLSKYGERQATARNIHSFGAPEEGPTI